MPVDSEFFKNINDVQLLWYQIQIANDEKEQFELLRDIAEYNSMFVNPEGVQKVRDSRENTYEVPEKDFKENLKEMFGRDMPEIPEEERVSFKDILDLEQQAKKDDRIEQYLDMELDDVKFIPID